MSVSGLCIMLRSQFGRTIHEKVFSKKVFKTFNIKEDECPICINPLKSKKTEKLICGHTFHRDCLLTDLKKRGTHNLYNCPMCRSKIHPNLIHHIN